ncbi:MAG: type II toxin-antitoxin system RelE/ParE family toxin [Nitrospinae bacterium]|nr:type II toxin-antitoxin system RelE/ParE family toxin [Nitrospinota bacterium]
MLHGFVKKTEKTPAREIELGIERMKDAIENL